METTLQEKYDNIIFDLLPPTLTHEIEHIREETDGFSDEDITPLWKANFNYIYKRVQKDYPTALKDYVAPPPTPEEIEAENQRLEEIRLEGVRKQEKIDKANLLLNKHKKVA